MSQDDSYVLVTGASGFVGANIVKYLSERGRKVLGTTRKVDGPGPLVVDYLTGLENNVDWVEVDLRDYDKVMSIVDNYSLDGIIHAAIFTAITREVEKLRAREILESNLMGTVNTLELARIAGVRRFVYVSSSGLYGGTPDIKKPVLEDSPKPYLKMRGFYSITKIMGEKITERYSQLFPMSTTSMRIAAPYGPMEKPTRSRSIMGPIYNLLKLVLTEKKKIIRVKGSTYFRDWTYVMDTARGLVAGLDAPEPISPLYNISCGVNTNIGEILTTLQEVSGIDFQWKEVKKEEEADFSRSSAPVTNMRGPLSIERAKKELGFRPQYNLRQGIKKYCEWWNEVTSKGLWIKMIDRQLK